MTGSGNAVRREGCFDHLDKYVKSVGTDSLGPNLTRSKEQRRTPQFTEPTTSRPGGLSGGKRSWHRQESQDLAHDAIALIGLEKKLSVRGTIQND